MAEMLIQSESLTAIADEIRVLSDTEDTMSLSAMESHISEANTDIDTEANLISQIAAALEGKAGGSGGGNTGVEDSIVMGTMSNYTNDRITSIGSFAFYRQNGLITVNFPKVTTIGESAFQTCHNLTTVNFPAATYIGSSAFQSCINLTTASFPALATISSWAFGQCYRLQSLYLTGSSLCTLSASNAFYSTPINGFSTYTGTYGSIYVPASLLTSYQTATNWTYFSSRFVGI